MSKRCGTCNTWQNWKRFIPASQLTLALLISLISVVAAVVPPTLAYFANRSHTYVRILGDGALTQGEGFEEEKTILVLVANNGKRPSIVKSAAISFNGIDAAPTELAIRNGDQKLVLPEKQVLLHLIAERVERTNGATKEAVLESLDNGYATVTVAVEETDLRGNFIDAQPAPAHRVAATLISEWMDQYVSSAP